MKKLFVFFLALIPALLFTGCDATLIVTREQCERQDQIKAAAFSLALEHSDMIGEGCEDVLKAVMNAGLSDSAAIYLS